MAEYYGGVDAFHKFLFQNVHYPVASREKGTKGQVIMGFVVEADGTLSNIRVVKKVDIDIDEEALRVMKLCPK